MSSKREFKEDPNVESSAGYGSDCLLTLHNDDVHDFEYVIESLVEICDHELVQAEQCTYLVHYRGKCEVKKGKYTQLKTMYDRLVERELTVTLN